MPPTILTPSHIHTFFGIPQKLIYDRGTSFMNIGFSIFLVQPGITHAPRTKWPHSTNGRVETWSKHLSRSFRCHLSEARNNWAKLACELSFGHNTSANSSTGTTRDEIFFGFKPQITFSLKLNFVSAYRTILVWKKIQTFLVKTLCWPREPRWIYWTEKLSSKIFIVKCIKRFAKPIIVLYCAQTSRNLRNQYRMDKKYFRKLMMSHSKNHKICANSKMNRTMQLKYLTRLFLRLLSAPIRPGLKSFFVTNSWKLLPQTTIYQFFLSVYEKPFNDEKTEHFYNEYARNWFSQINQPIESIVERQQLRDYLLIFPDTPGPSRMETTFNSPVKNNSCHSTPSHLASSLDSGIFQSSLTIFFSFQH